jgi:hypothetical protein
MSNLQQWLEENFEGEELLTADGFDEAFMGVITIANRPIALYDREKCIDLLMHQGMDSDEAAEYYEFNIACAYVGENTPAFFAYPYKNEEKETDHS